MKPLRKDLGYIKSQFLDVWDQMLFDEDIINHTAAFLERPVIDVVYFPIKELTYENLQEYLWRHLK